jgi:PPE-repeat protein
VAEPLVLYGDQLDEVTAGTFLQGWNIGIDNGGSGNIGIGNRGSRNIGIDNRGSRNIGIGLRGSRQIGIGSLSIGGDNDD